MISSLFAYLVVGAGMAFVPVLTGFFIANRIGSRLWWSLRWAILAWIAWPVVVGLLVMWAAHEFGEDANEEEARA